MVRIPGLSSSPCAKSARPLFSRRDVLPHVHDLFPARSLDVRKHVSPSEIGKDEEQAVEEQMRAIVRASHGGVEAIALHHTPRICRAQTFSPLTAVHVADALVWEREPVLTRNQRPAVDTDYLSALGLAHRLSAWRFALDESFASRKAKGSFH